MAPLGLGIVIRLFAWPMDAESMASCRCPKMMGCRIGRSATSNVQKRVMKFPVSPNVTGSTTSNISSPGVESFEICICVSGTCRYVMSRREMVPANIIGSARHSGIQMLAMCGETIMVLSTVEIGRAHV